MSPYVLLVCETVFRVERQQIVETSRGSGEVTLQRQQRQSIVLTSNQGDGATLGTTGGDAVQGPSEFKAQLFGQATDPAASEPHENRRSASGVQWGT